MVTSSRIKTFGTLLRTRPDLAARGAARATPPIQPPTRKEKKTPRSSPKMEPARGLPGSYVPSRDWAEKNTTEVDTYVEDLELPETLQPRLHPVWPEDIARESWDGLGTLLGQYTRWCQYLEEIVAGLDVSATELEIILEAVKAEVRLLAEGTVPDKTAICLTHPDVVTATQKWLTANAKSKVLKARTKGYASCVSAVSREISRRGGMASVDGMGNRQGNR